MKTNRFMESLHGRMKELVNSKIFMFVISVVIFLNPVAIAPQVVAALTAPSVEGVSVTMWVVFAFIQTAFALEGIRVKSTAMFFSMGISVFESLTVLVIVLVRG